MEDYPDVDAYLAASELWPEAIRALRPVLLASGLDETIKWGKPCYCLDDANVVVVQEFSDKLALMFIKGLLLDDPEGVLHEQGPNTHGALRMEFTSAEQVEAQADIVAAYLEEAMAVQRAGTPLPPRPEEPLADALLERLASDAALAEAFEALTPGRQREYNLHISDAKQASTRERRVDNVVPRILAGKGLRDR
ncbi:MAG: YdeI/OmpD-associated family protein [Myxococcota bacterium]